MTRRARWGPVKRTIGSRPSAGYGSRTYPSEIEKQNDSEGIQMKDPSLQRNGQAPCLKHTSVDVMDDHQEQSPNPINIEALPRRAVLDECTQHPGRHGQQLDERETPQQLH